MDIYGLLNSATRTPAPTFNPGSESFAGTVNVSITDANSSAEHLLHHQRHSSHDRAPIRSSTLPARRYRSERT